MKKCPTCQKTFDDNMRFCQTDGTSLVEDSDSLDPYATMVGSKDDFASAIPPEESSSVGVLPKEDDFLEIPDDDDPMKTSVVTEAEMRELAIEKDSSEKYASSPFGADSSVSESKPAESDFSSPPPPKFDEPDLNPPIFGNSPFSQPDSPYSSKPGTAGDKPFSSPIPSPFDEKMPPSYQTPSNSPFKDPEPPKNEPFSPFDVPSNPYGQSPFGDVEPKNMAVKQAEWTPPVSPAENFGESAIGQNPPPAGTSAVDGQSKTLAIVSLVLGILGFVCCGNILCGIPAIIVGFIARNKEAENPKAYAGSNLAMIGMILGGLSVLTFIVIIILQIFFGALGSILGNV